MRILRYLINASLVLSLSFAGLCASKAEANSNQWIDLDLLDHANQVHRTSPHSVLGYGYDTTKQTLSDDRILQADQEPMSMNLYEPNSGFACKTKVLKTSGSRWLANLSGVTYTSRGDTVMQFYSQNSTEMMHYPAGTQLSIIPDTTSNITQLEGFRKFRRSEVVISVSLGYLAALEVKIDFGSAEAFKAFQAARSPNPRRGAVNCHFNSNTPKPTMKYKIVEHGELVNGQAIPTIWDIAAGEGVSVSGENVDPVLQFDNISSLVRVSNNLETAYNNWREENQRKGIQRLGVVGVRYAPIDGFHCFSNYITVDYEGQTLNLKSVNDLLVARQEALQGCDDQWIHDTPQDISAAACTPLAPSGSRFCGIKAMKVGAIIGVLVGLGVGIYFLVTKQWNHSKQRNHSNTQNRFNKAMKGSSIIGTLGAYFFEPNPASNDSSPAEDPNDNLSKGS